jgi:hypothetical protein
MLVEVHIPGADRIESLRSYIQRLIHSGIGEHADRVRGVSVRLSEFWGPTPGSVWTSCRIEVDDASLPSALVAAALEPNPYRAADSAIERLRLLLREARRPGRTTPEAADLAKDESIAQRSVGHGADKGSWQSA